MEQKINSYISGIIKFVDDNDSQKTRKKESLNYLTLLYYNDLKNKMSYVHLFSECHLPQQLLKFVSIYVLELLGQLSYELKLKGGALCVPNVLVLFLAELL